MMKSKLGIAVLVDGQIVAWFETFTMEASAWCVERNFDKWVLVPAYKPRVVKD